MSINSIITKYSNFLKQDKYEEVFNQLSRSETKELINFLYNECGIDVLACMNIISDNMFEGFNSNSFVIPDTIKTIGNYAFSNSSISKIYMSDSVVEIGYGIFQDCTKLSEVRLSRNLTQLPNNTFSGCSSLQKIFIPDSITSIGRNAFQGCSNDLLIVANFRSNPENKIKFSGSDVDFYKQHLKFKKR